MCKLDLHTHSIASPDGGLTAADYRRMLERSGLDYIAVTDHNTISFAQELHRELGERIIVGEEIKAREGEIIGLFLRTTIPPDMSTVDAAALIRQQGGLVYIPHPFETLRRGLPERTLNEIADLVDIVETYNGRAMFQNRGVVAKAWAELHRKVTVGASDAHGWIGWGRAYVEVATAPTRNSLVDLLADALQHTSSVGARGILYPKLNRLKKTFGDA